MSETVRETGTLVKIESSLSLESHCEMICDEHGWEKGDYYDSFAEAVADEGYKTYHISEDDVVYKLEYARHDARDDWAEARVEGGVIHFDVQYYNGGACLSEMIDDALANMKRKQANDEGEKHE